MVISNQRGGIIGPGTIGKILKFATNTSAGDSLLSESGSTITVNGNLTASQGDLPSSVRNGPGVVFGSTTGSRAESTLTGQAIGTGDYTLNFRFQVPRVNPSLTQYAGAFTAAASDRLTLGFDTSGRLFTFFQKPSETSITTLHTGVTVASHGGQFIDVSVVRFGVTNALVYVNGALLSTGTISGPAVGNSFSATATHGTGNYGLDTALQSIITASRLFNRALSASDVLTLSLYGLSAADEWGSMVPWYTQNTSAGLDVWTTARATATGNIDGIVGKDNVLRAVIDSTPTNTHYFIWSAPALLKPGIRHKVTGSIYCPTSNTSDGWRLAFGEASGAATASGGKSASWQTFSVESNPTTGPNVVIYFTNGGSVSVSGNGTDELYVADLQFTQLGALVDLDMATGGGTTLIDRSANRLDATLYGNYTHTKPIRESIVEGGTITVNNPFLSATQTWNNGAVVMDGLKYVVTDTASDVNSRFIDFLISPSNRKFSLGKSGDLNTWGLYTDSTNYRRLRLTQSSGGAATIQSAGLGTGVSGNTLAIGANDVVGINIGATGVSIPVNLAATQGDLPSTARVAGGSIGGVQFGSTAGSRAESVLAGQAIGTNDYTVSWRVRVPTATLSGTQFAGTLRESAGNGLTLYFTTSGTLYTDFAKTAESTIATAHPAISTALLGGQWIDITVTRSGSTNAFVYLNGSLLSTGTLSGPAIGVSYTTAAVLNTGNQTSAASGYQAGPFTASRLFNRALSAADVLALSLYGVSAADEWGTMVPFYSSVFTASSDGFVGTRCTLTFNEDGIGTPSTDDTLKAVVDGTAGQSHMINRTTALVEGKRYRVTASIFIPTTNSMVNGLIFYTGNATVIGGVTNSSANWQTYSGEFVASGPTFFTYMAVNGVVTFNGNSTDTVFLKNIVITPIGCLIDLDMATGGGTTLADRSSNRLNATLYGAYNHIIPRRDSIIESGTLISSSPGLGITQTWNNGAVGFEALNINITDTASIAGSYFSAFRLGGTTKFSVTKDGYVFISQGLSTPYLNFGNTGDTFLYKDAAGTLSQRNSTNSQTLLTYGTYTDTNNYRRLRHTVSTGGVSTIASEGLGAGVSGNTLVLSANGTTAIDIGAAGVNIPVNLAATQGSLPSSVRVSGGVTFGSTSGSRAESTLTGQAIGLNDLTIAFRMFIPTALPTESKYFGQLLDSSTNRIFFIFATSGNFQVASSASGTTSYTCNINVNTLFPGQIIDYVLTRVGTTISVYINGALLATSTNASHAFNLPANITFSSGGLGGVSSYLSPFYGSRLFNRALTLSEIANLSLYGLDQSDEWATMVPLYSSDFSAGLDGWSGTRASVTGNIDGVGSPSTDNTLQIVVDGTAANSHTASRAISIITGKRYKLSASIFIPVTNSLVDTVEFQTTAGIGALSGASANWQTYSSEFVASGSTLWIFLKNGGNYNYNGNSTDTVYLKDLTITPIGCLLDLDLGTGGGTTLIDRSANRLDATLYGAYTHTVPNREVVIDSGTLTANNPAISATQTWNNAGVTFEGISLNVVQTASASNSRALVLKSSGVDKFIAYASGGFYASADSTITGYLGLGGVGDLLVRREANGQMTLRNGVNPQSFRVFGTYTDASNYRSLDLTTTTGGATKLDSKGLGTGLSGNTLQLAVNGLTALDIAADGDATFNYDLNAASGSVLTRIRTQAGAAPAVMFTPSTTSRVDATISNWVIGTGAFSIAVRFEVPTVVPAGFQSVFGLYEDSNNRILVQLPASDILRLDAYKAGAVVSQNILLTTVARYGGQIIDLVVTRSGTTITAFVNGVQVLSAANTSADISFTSAAKLVAGNRDPSVLTPYLSRIYNTQLYTRALSAADCADLAQKGINPADQWVDGSALYTQNTSAGVDGWLSTAVTATGNIDGIAGQDDTLRVALDSTAASIHRVYRAPGTVGKRYKATGSVYIPSTNSVVNTVKIYNNTQLNNITTLDAWTSFSAEYIEPGNGLTVYMCDDGALTFDGNGTDVIYLKNIVITPIGCALSWRYVGPGPTFADDSSNAYLGMGVGVSQTLPSSGGTYTYEARFLASAISTSAGTTKLIDLPINAGVIDIEVLRNAAMDGAITLDVGTSGTAAKYASAMAMDATGLVYADSLSKGSESATAVTPIYVKKSGSTTVGDITVRITVRCRH